MARPAANLPPPAPPQRLVVAPPEPPLQPDAEVLATLSKAKKRRIPVGYLVGGVLVLAAIVGGLLYAFRPVEGPRFETAAVSTRTLVVTVTATGTLEPLNRVDVGAEISGRVGEVLVDINDRVESGQVLARLDTELMRLQVDQALAQVAVAEANVAQASASLADSRNNLARITELHSRKATSSSDLDSAKAVVDRARPALKGAKAQLRAARSALAIARTNLKKAEIRSPIGGTVITRMIEPGQVVVSALQAPVLFRVAEDLEKMELRAEIDEADIGHIRVGQKATFSVAAFPGREFPASLTDVYNAPTTVQQVVTYQALLAVENKELLLRPGMTATVKIITEQHDDAKVVSNAALRFTPPQEHRAGPPQPPPSSPTGEAVWTLDAEGTPQMVPVRTGGTDGEYSIVVEGDLPLGTEVVVGRVREDKS